MAIVMSKKRKKLKDEGFDPTKLITAKYSCGHPSINSPSVCNIDGNKIKNINVEDETTFKNKITLARMAMIGIFAFALKKREKQELAYLTIDWNDGRFDHSTIFEFEGIQSLKRANTARNEIINSI
ncbi:MAG: hypothetical protein F8N15_03600 [Methanobacterium sp.]|nr:hypothetical protein [Methanobacterium sp.]